MDATTAAEPEAPFAPAEPAAEPSTEVATIPESRGSHVTITFTAEQVAIIRDTICRPRYREATEAELGLFLARCKRTGLDPLAGQIHAVFRQDRRTGGERMTIQVGIDGFRLVAQRTGEFAGSTTEWCGPDGAWRDVWLEPFPPSAARCTAYRIVQGRIVGQTAVATWAEYGDTRNVWKGKPSHMLAKCAQALALRSMFPAELSGLYTTDEMDQAEEAPAPAPALAAPPEWANAPDRDMLREATIRALDACGVSELAHGDCGRALLQAVKAATGGALPAVAAYTLHAVADVAQAHAADERAALDAAAAADRDPDPGEVLDADGVQDPPEGLPGIAQPASPEPRSHYEED